MYVPHELLLIFAKPGKDWRPDERCQVTTWLYEPPQQSYLLIKARRCLGKLATVEDAEDVWAEFYPRRLATVIGKYNPSICPFDYFLINQFVWFCHDEGEKIRRRAQREPPLPTRSGDTGPMVLELADETADHDPEYAARQQQFLAAFSRCFTRLSKKEQVVFRLYRIEGCTKEKAAERATILLQEEITANYVGVLDHRARKQLTSWLRMEGWEV